jgi:hypothetical protein
MTKRNEMQTRIMVRTAAAFFGAMRERETLTENGRSIFEMVLAADVCKVD